MLREELTAGIEQASREALQWLVSDADAVDAAAIAGMQDRKRPREADVEVDCFEML